MMNLSFIPECSIPEVERYVNKSGSQRLVKIFSWLLSLIFFLCAFQPVRTSPDDDDCLSITSIVSEIDFGWMMTSSSKSYSADDPHAMCYKITGRRGTQLMVTVTRQVQLGVGGGAPTFTRSAVMYSTTSAQTGLVTFINAGVSSGTVTLPHSGGGGQRRSIWIWIGGTMSVPANGTSGSKTGTVTIQVQKMDD